MLIPAEVGVAVRCMQCGQAEIVAVSLFNIASPATIAVTCECGHQEASVQRRLGRVSIEMSCMLCETPHQAEISLAHVRSGPMAILACADTGLFMGALGPETKVREWAAAHMDSERVGPEMAAYFVNPEVMYEVLSAVHGLDEQGRLGCRCGNTDIEYDLQPDRLDLVCNRCKARRSLAATTADDAARALRARRMIIGAGGRPGVGPSRT